MAHLKHSPNRRGRRPAGPRMNRTALFLSSAAILVLVTVFSHQILSGPGSMDSTKGKSQASAGSPSLAQSLRERRDREQRERREGPILTSREAPDSEATIGSLSLGQKHDLLASPPDSGIRNAPEDSSRRTKPAPLEGSRDSSPLKIVLALLGLCSLFGLMIAATLKWMRRSRLAPAGKKLLSLVDALPLGPKRCLYVVRLEHRTLVVASGPDQVTLMTEYENEEPSEAEAIPSPAPAQEPKRAKIPLQVERAAAASDFPVDDEIIHKFRQTRPNRTNGMIDITINDPMDSEVEDALPPGAHRVPPAFRHLLKKSILEQSASS